MVTVAARKEVMRSTGLYILLVKAHEATYCRVASQPVLHLIHVSLDVIPIPQVTRGPATQGHTHHRLDSIEMSACLS
jgi:hypothetical protein